MKLKLTNLRATLLAILTMVCLTSAGYTYKEVMVPCKDGTKLMTHIYLPDGEGPWPVVCTRTPYNFKWQGDQNEEVMGWTAMCLVSTRVSSVRTL